MAWLQLGARSLWDDLLTAAVSGVAFTGAYLFIRHAVFPKQSADFSNRMTSLVHAVAMLPVSAAVLDFREPWRDFGTRTTPAQAMCLSITFGYFVYDSIGVAAIQHDWTNTWHHAASMAAFAVGIFGRTSGPEIAWSLFVMELTNPLLHASSYFKELGKEDTLAANVTNVLFLASFSVCRLCVGPALAYAVLRCPTSHPIVKAGGCGVQLVSFYWGWKVAKIVHKKLCGKDKKRPPKSTQ